MKRAEAVCFDESGFMMEEVFNVIEPYTAQNKDFKLGGGIDVTVLPRELPNQLLYTSSASTVDSAFYTKYKEYSKQMFLGSNQHFVADMNCEVVLNATLRGKVYPVSLLSQEKIDNALKENPEKAKREYYNQFTEDGGEKAVVKRAQVAKNSVVRPPILYNDTDDRLFVFAYDPARSLDNSVVGIGELYEDEVYGWKLRIANLVNFMDSNTKKKTPMTTPQQVSHLKGLLVKYNGKELDYDNIESLMIDAGSGGAGVNIADYLMENWYEEGHEGDSDYKHRGLIDKIYSEDYVRLFPEAVDKIRLLNPNGYKSEMYRALGEMMTQDLIEFSADYNNKGYLQMLEVDEVKREKAIKTFKKNNSELKEGTLEYEELLDEYLSEQDFAITTMYTLTPEEEKALKQIDLMKTEAYNMIKIERAGAKDSFELSKEKQSSMHDDRAYVLAMLAFALQEKRREKIKKGNRPKVENLADILPMKRGTYKKAIG